MGQSKRTNHKDGTVSLNYEYVEGDPFSYEAKSIYEMLRCRVSSSTYDELMRLFVAEAIERLKRL